MSIYKVTTTLLAVASTGNAASLMESVHPDIHLPTSTGHDDVDRVDPHVLEYFAHLMGDHVTWNGPDDDKYIDLVQPDSVVTEQIAETIE